MSLVEITAVERLTAGSDALLGYSIDLPKAGATAEAYCFELAGWVLGNNTSAVEVELIANDGPVRTLPVLYPRSDVDRCYPQAAAGSKVGFWSPVSVVGMTPDFELFVQAVLEGGVRVPMARLRGRHQSIPSLFRPSIQPLLVTSLGRMGTTWVMRLLAEHPNIAALRLYPYETRPGRYWMQLLGAMVEPAFPAQSASRLGILEEDWWSAQDPFQRASLGRYPALQQWFNAQFVEQTASLCQRSIEDCYQQIAVAQHQQPTYFAEKHIPDEAPGIIWELYPHAREIFVVRDLRDMLCSIRAFNTKRGTLGFARNLFNSEEEYVQYVARVSHRLLSSWRTRKARACLVRYEDLLQAPETALQSMLAYLDLERGSSVIDGMLQRAMLDTPELQAHRTSSDALASIGRWRSDLDPATQQLCDTAFGDALAEFGYEDRE